MSKPKYIKTWKELSKMESPTHILKIDLDYGSGWIHPKNDLDFNGWDGHYYLSTHTFYGGTHKQSTEILQQCEFNVELANWDELGW